MKTTSCGILVCNADEELLLCHATGTSRWDIPSQMNPGSSRLIAAASSGRIGPSCWRRPSR